MEKLGGGDKEKTKNGERRKIQIAAQSSRAIRFSVILAPSSTSARSRKPIMWLTYVQVRLYRGSTTTKARRAHFHEARNYSINANTSYAIARYQNRRLLIAARRPRAPPRHVCDAREATTLSVAKFSLRDRIARRDNLEPREPTSTKLLEIRWRRATIENSFPNVYLKSSIAPSGHLTMLSLSNCSYNTARGKDASTASREKIFSTLPLCPSLLLLLLVVLKHSGERRGSEIDVRDGMQPRFSIFPPPGVHLRSTLAADKLRPARV